MVKYHTGRLVTANCMILKMHIIRIFGVLIGTQQETCWHQLVWIKKLDSGVSANLGKTDISQACDNNINKFIKRI